MSPHGLTIVFTGNGKGKTSAALGIALRAWGHNLSVGVIQFIKSAGRPYGEALAAQQMGIRFQTLGAGFTWCDADQKASKEMATKAWKEAQKWIVSNAFDVILLDEMTYLFYFRWLDVNEVISWLKQYKPPLLNLIITGRNAPRELVAFADLVTEMQEIKHPLREQGISAQIGVDF